MVLDGKLCAAAGAANALAANSAVARKRGCISTTTSLELTARPAVLHSSIAVRGLARQRLALLWQILSGTGFPDQVFNDSWVVGFGGADDGWQDVGLEGRAWTLAPAVS